MRSYDQMHRLNTLNWLNSKSSWLTPYILMSRTVNRKFVSIMLSIVLSDANGLAPFDCKETTLMLF